MLHVIHPFDEIVGRGQACDVRRVYDVHHFPPAVCDDGTWIRHPGDPITSDDPLGVILAELAGSSHEPFRIRPG